MVSRRSFLKGCAAALTAMAVPIPVTPEPKHIPINWEAAHDIRQRLNDQAIKEMMAEEDARFMRAVRAAA